MSELHEFASPDWIAAVSQLGERVVRDASEELGDTAFSLNEVYTSVPERIPSEDGTAAWWLRYDSGTVDSGTGLLDGATWRITVEWEVMLPFVQTRTGDCLPSGETSEERRRANAAAGRSMQAEGDFDAFPEAFQRLVPALHDAVADVTAK